MDTLPLIDRINAARTKEDVITVIKASPLPKRFRQGLLQTWAQDHGVVLTGVDYLAVVA
jgi:tRNA G37 N-methylase TrmD